MICFGHNCDSEEFVIELVDVEQLYHGKIYIVNTPVSVCVKCGRQILAKGQSNELMTRLKAQLKQESIDLKLET